MCTPQSIFDKLRGVWKCYLTLSQLFDIHYIFSIETKTNRKKEKYNHKNLCLIPKYCTVAFVMSFALTWWIMNEFENPIYKIAEILTRIFLINKIYFCCLSIKNWHDMTMVCSMHQILCATKKNVTIAPLYASLNINGVF